MRDFVLIAVGLIIIVFGSVHLLKEKVAHDLAQPITLSKPSPTPTYTIDKNATVTTSVFVPYWAFDGDPQQSELYDQYIYFGITPDANGIEQEAGSARVELFLEVVPDGKEKLLALRMVDSETNAAVLKDTALQQKIIKQTSAFAREHGFNGIVLDLEISALPFESLVNQITQFTKTLGQEARVNDLTFSMTMYGDAFYRVRPFAVKELAQEVDQMLLMAYDFHKSRGNPGPNFPLAGEDKYGYDYANLSNDFLGAMPPEKISVVFGMFGYDWEVDNDGKATAYGEPLTYLQIKRKFLDNCPYTNCVITRDAVSSETKITYTDEEGDNHIVWFEDNESAKAKQEYLKQRGITNFSYWAYSYY